MAVSLDTILRLAEMTRIGLEPEEAGRLTADIEAILAHVSRLRTVDTGAVDAQSIAPDVAATVRPDMVRDSLTVDDVLANAPDRHDGFFVVPAVLGD